MWSLFKKRSPPVISENQGESPFYEFLNRYYLLVQSKWVNKMNSLTAGLSRRGLIYLLFLFVILAGAISIYIMYRGLNSHSVATFQVSSTAKVIQVK